MTPTLDRPGGEVSLLLSLIDEAFDRPAWHGPNLRGALRGLSGREAARRPAPGRHNIWEIALHAAYWKYAVRRRLTGEKRGSFPAKGSNWFERPGRAGAAVWRDDLALLDREHRLLRETIAGLPPRKLHQRSAGSRHDNSRLVYGIAAHDLYHAGQIRLLKVLGRKGRG
jgi:hypothetical protein